MSNNSKKLNPDQLEEIQARPKSKFVWCHKREQYIPQALVQSSDETTDDGEQHEV